MAVNVVTYRFIIKGENINTPRKHVVERTLQCIAYALPFQLERFCQENIYLHTHASLRDDCS